MTLAGSLRSPLSRSVLTDVQVNVGRPTFAHTSIPPLPEEAFVPTLANLTLSQRVHRARSLKIVLEWRREGHHPSKGIVDAIPSDPDLTIGALRARLTTDGRPLLVQTGLDFNIDAKEPLDLGKGTAARTETQSTLAFRRPGRPSDAILSSDAFAGLKGQPPADLGTLLHDHTTLSGQNALVVIAAGGEADAQFSSTVLNRPGVNVGISFKAGAGVSWVVCRPARDADKVLDAIRETFGWAQLPQSDLEDILAAGKSVTLRPNEILSTSFNGFMSLGGEATFGYDTSGATKYVLGAIDLATKLVLKARAKVNVGYSLAGAFKTTVLPVDARGWVRVVVKKIGRPRSISASVSPWTPSSKPRDCRRKAAVWRCSNPSSDSTPSRSRIRILEDVGALARGAR